MAHLFGVDISELESVFDDKGNQDAQFMSNEPASAKGCDENFENKKRR